MSNHYTVTLILNLEADNPQDAAEQFREWFDTTSGDRSLTVEDDDTLETTEVEV